MLNVYDAIAHVHGSDLAPEVHGTVKFLGVSDGTGVEAEIFGLPPFSAATADTPQIGPFAFHIHNGSSCGMPHGDEPFSDAHGHWNPGNDVHGNHAGDFPVLFSNGGTAKMLFFTNRYNTRIARRLQNAAYRQRRKTHRVRHHHPRREYTLKTCKAFSVNRRTYKIKEHFAPFILYQVMLSVKPFLSYSARAAAPNTHAPHFAAYIAAVFTLPCKNMSLRCEADSLPIQVPRQAR